MHEGSVKQSDRYLWSRSTVQRDWTRYKVCSLSADNKQLINKTYCEAIMHTRQVSPYPTNYLDMVLVENSTVCR